MTVLYIMQLTTTLLHIRQHTNKQHSLIFLQNRLRNDL